MNIISGIYGFVEMQFKPADYNAKSA